MEFLFEAAGQKLYLGEANRLDALDNESISAVVCDPPYGLEFMGKDWDHGVPGVPFWTEALRVLKPGGHLLAFGGTRTHHRLMVAIEDAGFEIRDCLMWLYGTGFPKSLNVGKAIDKVNGQPLAYQQFARAYAKVVGESKLSHADIDRHLKIKSSSCYWERTDHRGKMPPRHHWEKVRDLLDLDIGFVKLYEEAERSVIRAGVPKGKSRGVFGDFAEDEYNYTAPATVEAKQWDGWGTALKPAWEPIILARKPLIGTVAKNVLEHGTGGLNIDATRIGLETISTHSRGSNEAFPKRPGETTVAESGRKQDQRKGLNHEDRIGRFPANLTLSHSEDCVEVGSTQIRSDGHHPKSRKKGGLGTAGHAGQTDLEEKHSDGESVVVYACIPSCPVRMLPVAGGGGKPKQTKRAQSDVQFAGDLRFEYEPYADTASGGGSVSRFFYTSKASTKERSANRAVQNDHPTVKPLALMQWLLRLVTPPNGLVLDQFCGSGSTLIAAYREGIKMIGVDNNDEYLMIALERLDAEESA